MIEEPNGNNTINVKLSSSSIIPIASSTSNDDLSQSLSVSEYTDADESMSAPTEYLAEFLSAVMQKDYRKALKYCKLILDFEPNNITAKEFYPLIEEKMKIMEERSSSDDENENYNNVFLTPDTDEVQNMAPTPDERFLDLRTVHIDEIGNLSTDNDSSGDESEDYSTGENQSDFEEKYLDASNKSITSNNNSESENTTYSYSNSLLEDEYNEEEENDEDAQDDMDESDSQSDLDEADDQVEPAMIFLPNAPKGNLPDLSDLNNGNYKSTSCSDSESPTEPLTQKVVAIFRSGFASSKESK